MQLHGGAQRHANMSAQSASHRRDVTVDVEAEQQRTCREWEVEWQVRAEQIAEEPDDVVRVVVELEQFEDESREVALCVHDDDATPRTPHLPQSSL